MPCVGRWCLPETTTLVGSVLLGRDHIQVRAVNCNGATFIAVVIDGFDGTRTTPWFYVPDTISGTTTTLPMPCPSSKGSWGCTGIKLSGSRRASPRKQTPTSGSSIS